MSHLTKMNVCLDSMEAIKKSLEEMGYGFIENPGKINSSWGWNLSPELQVTSAGKKLPVGFTKNKDGSYDVQADWWGFTQDSKKFTDNLKQLHAKHKLISVAAEKGFTLEGSKYVEKDGKKLLQVSLSAWDGGSTSMGGSDFASKF